MSECSILGCDRSARARQMCNMHYQRVMRHGDPYRESSPVRTSSNEERFWHYVDKTEDCWNWLGGRRMLRGGYGQFHYKANSGKVTNMLAHRYSAQLAGMQIDGLFVCHKCDNPRCVRPEHLFVGTHVDNMNDRSAKNRVVSPRGERHFRAILTEVQVKEMRRLRAENNISYKELSAIFGVAEPTVGFVITRRTWRHVS